MEVNFVSWKESFNKKNTISTFVIILLQQNMNLSVSSFKNTAPSNPI